MHKIIGVSTKFETKISAPVAPKKVPKKRYKPLDKVEEENGCEAINTVVTAQPGLSKLKANEIYKAIMAAMVVLNVNNHASLEMLNTIVPNCYRLF